MMEGLSLSSTIRIAAKSVETKCLINQAWYLLKKKKKKRVTISTVHCQSGGGSNALKSTSSSRGVLTEREALVKGGGGDHHGTTSLMDVYESLVLAANENNNNNGNAEITVKDLVPFGKPTTTSSQLVEVNDEDDAENGIGIVQFLRGKTFLITGATGFLAKVLIEKIIRTVPDVGKIYVLIKAKNEEAAMERLKSEIISSGLFKCLQQSHGKSYLAYMLSKLVPVAGNVTDSNLGLDQFTSDIMGREVDIIVNSAANTAFDERYDVALDINTGGPSRLMSFAKKCNKLKLFLQVSTAYVNGQRQGRIMEKPFYAGDTVASENLIFGASSFPTLSVENEIKLVLESKGTLQDSALAQKMKELGLNRAKKYGWQDTYVFTKAMGEMLIDSMRGDVPVVIMRPSVIESTYREPFPGWIEGNRMMDPIVLYYGKGHLNGFFADPDGVLDVVPADMVVNATLAAIAKHGGAGKSESSIYQIASSVVNPLAHQELVDLIYEHFNSRPCLDAKGRPIHVPRMRLFRSMEDFSSHLWRHAIERSGLETIPDLNGKESRKLEKMCRNSVEQTKRLANLYEAYTFYGGRFDSSNTEELMERMSEEERSMFGFDVGSIDWRDYISNVHVPGLRRHVMKGRGTSSS